MSMIRYSLMAAACLFFVACVDTSEVKTGINADAPNVLGRPNIIIIMTDDQGYGDLGAHQNPVIQTPQMDRLRDESVRFTQFHVDPTCSPTRAALMSGQNSIRAGVWHTVMGRSLMPTEKVTVAEMLRDEGYDTALFGKWHLGDNYPYRPQDQGFDRVTWHGGGGVGQTPDYWGNNQFNDTYEKDGEWAQFTGNSTDVWFDEAEDFIRNRSDEPFFVYIAPNAPHRPWRASDDRLSAYADAGLPDTLKTFYSMITHVDDRLGQLRDMLEDEGIEDNTLLIFMTDNGSAFAFREQFLTMTSNEFSKLVSNNPGWIPNAGLRGFKTDLYEGGHKVPFFLHWPAGELDIARDIAAPAAHYDILPTLADIVGAKVTLDTDGTSLKPLLSAKMTTLPDRNIIVPHQRQFIPTLDRPLTLISGKWRYVRNVEADSYELFDIEADSGQTNNIFDDHADRVAIFENDLAAWWATATADGFSPAYIPIGGGRDEEVRLTAMDWMEAESDAYVPWSPGFDHETDVLPIYRWVGREDEYQSLPWYIDLRSAGEYEIDVYFHDKPAGTPAPGRIAQLSVGDQMFKTDVKLGASFARFKLNLPSGQTKLEAKFEVDATVTLPAFYVYVRPQ